MADAARVTSLVDKSCALDSLALTMRDLYLEIVDFLHSGGGPYRVMHDDDTLDNLIDALHNERCVVARDDSGQIVTFCDYWLVHPEDLEMVRQGGRPEDVNTGSVFFVVDCVNKVEDLNLLRTFKTFRKEQPTLGVAWFHKRKRPENFRYFPALEVEHG